MRKALRIIIISTGIVSIVSTVILGCIYMEDIVRHVDIVKMRIKNKTSDKAYAGREYECE